MNRKINKNFLIIGSMILATVLAFFLISIFSKNNSDLSPGVVTEAALKEEILQLESNLLELELVFSERDDQVENFEALLDEKYLELEKMDSKVKTLEQKIDKLEREGKVDKRTIREMRAKLAEARGKFVENLKGEINILVMDLHNLTQRNDSLDLLAKEREYQIDSLNGEYNDCLKLAAGTSSKPSIDPVIPVSDMPKGLIARNIKAIGLDKNLDLLNREDGSRPINRKKLRQIDFKFNLEGQGVAAGVYPLHIVMVHKDGEILIGTGSNSGKTFSHQGRTLRSTNKISANFNGRGQVIAAEFKDENTLKNAKKGRYSLFVYLEKPNGESDLIGTADTKPFLN